MQGVHNPEFQAGEGQAQTAKRAAAERADAVHCRDGRYESLPPVGPHKQPKKAKSATNSVVAEELRRLVERRISLIYKFW